ncbi:MAG TPA: fused MFS/spermidine synthase [Alphaproteobacteria bacterium]
MSPSFVGTPTRIASPLLLFGSAIFLSAWLLFQVQPMFAKMALPLLGGAPAVWNTALVFFQATLLLGYVYAHFLGTRLPLKLQIVVHVGVLGLAFILLPVAIGDAWRDPPETMPMLWLVGLLTVSVGLPFFALSATSPLLQRWFGETAHESARDPYFLYGASNLGSLLALVAYPVLLEPSLALAEQSSVWTFAYVVLAIAIGAAGCFTLYRGRTHGTVPRRIEQPTHPVLGAPDWRKRLEWVLLACVPSGLLVAVTTLITTDLVAIPLFWVIPLTLYLLSFVLVFARRPLIFEKWMLVAQTPLLVVTALVATWNITKYHYLVIALVLATLFVTSMVCHGRLVQRRPPTRHLTEFYVWMSAGGILGSAFAALLAPLLFDRVIELSILCAAAAFLRPRTDFTEEKKEPRGLTLAASAMLREISFPVAGMALAVMLTPHIGSENGATALLLLALVAIFALVFTVLSAGRPLRFGLCIVALALFGMQFVSIASASIVHRDRTFFGTHVIKKNTETGYLIFVHGSTTHGAQNLAPGRRREKHTYYHAGSGFGRLYAALTAAGQLPKRVGAVGLGAGEIACYRSEGQDWTFFEIDPAVSRIAASGKLFTFLPQCAPKARIVIGDGRLTLAREPNAGFDLLVLDAFASDSIPTHLVTREAFKLYLEKLAPGGIVLLHISNRYLDLEPVVAGLAADMKLAARLFDTGGAKMEKDYPYRFRSAWVALTRDEAKLKALTEEFDKTAPNAWGRWRALKAQPGLRVWTDDYSNIVTLMR